MNQKITVVDAFTSKPFSGNPAAVCILPDPRPEVWMQSVAREMNLSETAILLKQSDGYGLRWFTPGGEVDLCGHATLASAHVLWEEGHLEKTAQAHFHTRSGLLLAEWNGDWIKLDFPATEQHSCPAPPGLMKALGVTAGYIGKSRFDYFVEVDSEKTLRNLKPDFNLLGTVPMRGTIVTSPSASPEFDFLSRFFAPAFGINEDPVTGSAHCCLGPYWAKKLNKTELMAYQASPRGGVVKVVVFGDRIHLWGQAVTVLRGEFTSRGSYPG